MNVENYDALSMIKTANSAQKIFLPFHHSKYTT